MIKTDEWGVFSLGCIRKDFSKEIPLKLGSERQENYNYGGDGKNIIGRRNSMHVLKELKEGWSTI